MTGTDKRNESEDVGIICDECGAEWPADYGHRESCSRYPTKPEGK